MLAMPSADVLAQLIALSQMNAAASGNKKKKKNKRPVATKAPVVAAPPAAPAASSSKAGFRILQNLLSASAFFSASAQNVLVLVPYLSALALSTKKH